LEKTYANDFIWFFIYFICFFGFETLVLSKMKRVACSGIS